LGLVVNPIAGMGGRPGLKGTDGDAILHLAEEAGAVPMAPALALQAMEELAPLRDRLLVLTAGGVMGELACRQAGLRCRVVHMPGAHTTAGDTVLAAQAIRDGGARLLLFAGGDGTARDVYRAVGSGFPALGIPAGVKIHSPVYGNSPARAGRLAALFLGGASLPLKQEEVLDLDEAALREDRIVTSLYGYLTVPYKATHLQNKKAPSPLGEEAARRAIGLDVADHMKEDVLYLLGPGTTTLAVAQALGLSGSLMGVDVIENRRMIAKDVGETRLLELLAGRKAVLVVTPTGGQGFLLGRGNQQLSPRVLREIGRENLLILCTEGKLAALGGRPLLVYTGDGELDGDLAGIYRVKSGYGMDLMVRVVPA
jgi:predicted polyphosphate/ATP-dependent NAD kinase